MKTAFAAAAAVGLALTSAAAHAAAPTVRLDHLAAHVTIIPDARGGVRAEVHNAGKHGLAAPVVTVNGADMNISGDLPRSDRHNCRVRRGRGVGLGFFRHVDEADLPVVVLHVPLDVVIDADGAVEAEVNGTMHSLKVAERGCGDWRIGDVSDRLEYDLEGRGDMDAGAAGSTTLRLAGMGDLHVRATGPLDVSMAGMGDTVVGQVNGPVRASVSGMGGLHVRGGHATMLTADLSGMGGIRFDGVADTVEASASGMGEIRVAKATGSVRKSQTGLARVSIGR